MRSPKAIAIAAVAGVLAVGGTAVAAGGAGFLGGDPGERDAELARDLAKKLDGVSSAEVQKALGEVRDERRTVRRKEHAATLAAELDGVSAADVEKALAKLGANRPRRGEFRRFRRGNGPAAQLAKELGKSTAEVRRAMRAAAKKHLEARLAEAVKQGRITQAQANEIKKRFESGPPRFRHGRGGPGHGPGHHGFGFGGPPPMDAPGG